MINKIYRKDNEIYRVLKVRNNEVLLIDCIKKNMPEWKSMDFLKLCVCSEEETFKEEDDSYKSDLSELTKEQIKEMHLKYASISYLITKYDDEDERRIAINSASKQYGVSKQTIRNRLCDYLVYQDITCLAPRVKKTKELSKEEKNFRWALNKYFYNSNKLSLRQAYKYLIREKYLDSNGKILQNSPKFHQFKYFYYKNRNETNFIISRQGKGEYERNYRPLLGEGVREFCPSIGYGMLDSTVLDIYLVDDSGVLVGRPIMTACVDAYSSMCLGYSIGFEGGIKSLQKLMQNVVTNKVDLCSKFNINLNIKDWNCDKLPHKLITDKGKEYIGETFSQLTDLGCEILNLKPYRPELKSVVERFFGLIQELFKKELINKGVVLKDFGDRGAFDYRKNASLTLDEFEKILLLCIIHYNSKRVIDLPLDKRDLKPYASDLFNSGLGANRDTFIDVDSETLRLTLLPRCEAHFKRNGLIVNKLRYKNLEEKNRYLTGGKGTVCYNPNNLGSVWLIEKNNYIEYKLIDSYYENFNIEEIKNIKNQDISKYKKEELENEIKLNKDIDSIINN